MPAKDLPHKQSLAGGRSRNQRWVVLSLGLVALTGILLILFYPDEQKNWPERLNFVGAFLGPWVTVGGFMFLVKQLKDEKQALETQTNWEMYGSSIGVLNTFVEHPELRPYFYDARPLPAPSSDPCEDALRSKILAAAEVMADHLENIVNSGEDGVINEETYCVWIRYMKLMGKRSEALREILNVQPHPSVDVAATGFGEGVRYNEILRRIVREGYCPASSDPAGASCVACGSVSQPVLASA